MVKTPDVRVSVMPLVLVTPEQEKTAERLVERHGRPIAWAADGKLLTGWVEYPGGVHKIVVRATGEFEDNRIRCSALDNSEIVL